MPGPKHLPEKSSILSSRSSGSPLAPEGKPTRGQEKSLLVELTELVAEIPLHPSPPPFSLRAPFSGSRPDHAWLEGTSPLSLGKEQERETASSFSEVALSTTGLTAPGSGPPGMCWGRKSFPWLVRGRAL